MRRLSLLVALLSGCLHHHTHVAVDGAVLGRVVVYRNGVAFYERRARIEDGKLEVHVPRDRVDDFLKSLTVVDPATRQPLSVAIPRKEADDGSYLTMQLETPDRKQADVLLTYVTEAPAWKPSYRVVVGDKGKVMLEGWAIVDNVSGEDWKGVLVGVGASSALSFRYDLWSVRRIDRDLLAGEEKFAVAPPTGVSPYAEAGPSEELVSLDASELRNDIEVNKNVPAAAAAPAQTAQVAQVDGAGIIGRVTDSKSGQPLPGVTVIATSPSLKQTQTAITDDAGDYRIGGLSPGNYLVTFYYADVTLERSGIKLENGRVANVTQKLDQSKAGGEVIHVAARAPTIDTASTTAGVTITKDYMNNVPVPGRTFSSSVGAAAGSKSDGVGTSFSGSSSLENEYYVNGINTTGTSNGASPPPPPPPIRQGDEKLKTIAAKVLKSKKDVVVETHGASAVDVAKRAEAVRNKLVDDGVPAAKIHLVPRVGPTESNEVRLLSVAPGAGTEPTAPPRAHTQMPDTPVGESHFMAEHPMNVRAGSSAMVAMVHGETTGGVVYLYDPISERGDARYAFKAVRLDNPTKDTLEPGPVTVYGDGRFIGEGITEPVPPSASVVVPFALDRQVIVEHMDNQSDRIAKLVTVQRGVVTAEVQHRRSTRFTITSRLHEPTKVYLRHRLESGWALVEAPSHFTKVGDSQLFEVDLNAGETKYVTIAESTPIERTLDLGAPDAIGMMKVYVDDPEASPVLQGQLKALLATHQTGADLEDRIGMLRDQLAEYKAREGELHGQLVTLKLVKTGGDLMEALRKKLNEISGRVQKTTIEIVEAQEQVMLTRVKFENQLAELHM
ncbi:MAG: carboxypeptidase regulatory-like domain-containing protein [Deltaproteobacteria bacterium]|nr:carboxypeptidase regulatory-like domain-containing protein [Deltaproteobacteria bacterium]